MQNKDDATAGQKCICGTTMRKVKTKLELFGGDIVINDVDAFFCPGCGEELFSSEQATAAQDRVHETFPGFEAFSIRKKVTKVGNSLTVPLSKELADYLGVKKGDDVRITIKNRHRLIVDVS
jgi:YgiT-type zinc finger domain-containing protein